MHPLIDWAALFALVCYAMGLLCAALRLWRGPTSPDRVLALDAMYIQAILILLVLGIRFVFRHCALDGDVWFCGVFCDGEIPAARRGHRTMNAIPLWIAIPAALLLVVSGLLALCGAAGLLRFSHFYPRVHAPTLGNTMGIGCVLFCIVLIVSWLERVCW